mgnify:CR=1 FL=1
MLRGILTFVFVAIVVILTVVVLLQEGKSAGLSGTITVWLTATGEETRAVPWRENWRSLRSTERFSG